MEQIIFYRPLFFIPTQARLFVWLLLTLFSLSLCYVVGIIAEKSLGLFLMLCASSLGFLSLPIAFLYCQSQLLRLSRFFENFISGNALEAATWFTHELRFFRGNRWMYIVGFTTSGVATISMYRGGFFEPIHHATSLIVAFGILGASAFMAGMGLCAIFSGCKAIFGLGTKYDVIVDFHKYGVLMIGTVLVRCFVITGITWSFYVLSAFVGATSVTIDMKVPIISLVIPTLLFFILSFIICQLSLHDSMVEFKRRRILRLQKRIFQYEFIEGRELSIDDLQMLEFLRKEKNYVLSLPEWPFRVQALGAIMATSLTSVWPAILTTVAGKWLDNFLHLAGSP